MLAFRLTTKFSKRATQYKQTFLLADYKHVTRPLVLSVKMRKKFAYLFVNDRSMKTKKKQR